MVQDGMQLDDEAPYRGASAWAYAVRFQFQKSKRKVLWEHELGDMHIQLQKGAQSLWIVARWPSGASLAIRTSFSPEEGLKVVKVDAQEWSVDCDCNSPAGRYNVNVAIPAPDKPILHFTVRLTPAGQLSIPFWPSDTYPIDSDGDPFATRGVVHAAQRGPAMAFMYASLLEPRSGTFLYFQDLTSMNPLCEQTRSVPETRVGGSWPELGYTPPIAERIPLQKGKEVTVSDGYFSFSREIPEHTGDLAELFFDMLADIYLELPRPEATYHDWLPMAEQSIIDLSCDDCMSTHGDNRYLCAYVGTGDRRPESMVQLAVALPLIEYEEWRGERVPLISDLRETLQSFYYDDVKCVMRYPFSMKDKVGTDADEKGSYEVDSWYLYHPLVNLARLAQRGCDEARHLLMNSIEYAIQSAHHFQYRWPVIFEAASFEEIRSAQSRELGETDTAGLYAYLMLQMRDLTGDERYLGEAKKAVEHLKGLNFNVGYQFNNTAWSANALAKLWRETEDDLYLHLSSMCLASIMQNAFIWDCDYGYAKYYSTFMAITPLRQGPYIAAYEEMEVYSALHEYLELVGDSVRPSIGLLISEYCKYATDGRICAYPSKLPSQILAEPRNGKINRDLAIPLEDIYQGWEKPGQVGQEVYGGGLAAGMVTRCYHRVPAKSALVYCQYPVKNFATQGNRCEFDVRGSAQLNCKVRIMPSKHEELGDASLRVGGELVECKRTPDGHIECEAPGAAHVEITWQS